MHKNQSFILFIQMLDFKTSYTQFVSLSVAACISLAVCRFIVNELSANCQLPLEC